MWLDLMSGLIDTGKGYLAKAADTTLTDDEMSLLVNDSEMIGNQAYNLLQEMDGSDAGQIPHQIVGPFQRWVDGLGIGNTIFFRADHVANYELARFELPLLQNINDASQTLIDAAAAVKWPFLRVTVPSQAMGMLPHFAIVGHELGHAIQNDIKVDLSSIDSTDVGVALVERLADEGIDLTHRKRVTAANVDELRDFDFVFVCVDKGSSRREIAQGLLRLEIPFVDTGIGVGLEDDGMDGCARATFIRPGTPWADVQKLLPFGDDSEEDDVYRTDIQIAAINSLNAILAILRWKRWARYFRDERDEVNSVYMIEGNNISNRSAA